MDGALVLIRKGLMQTDLDANHFKILNLDVSNLPIPPEDGILPPTIDPIPKFWINGWDKDAVAWHIDQPGFSDLRAPIGSVGFANQRMTSLGDAVNPQDAVNFRTLQNYVNLLPNLHVHPPCIAATTGVEILQDLTRPVDGHVLADGDRILVKNQGSGREYENGIYVAHNGPWTRATDMDDKTGHPEEFDSAYLFVTAGDTQANTGWVQLQPPPYGTLDPIKFVLVSRSGGGQPLVAGNGLDITGNVISAIGAPGRIAVNGQIDIDPAYPGQPSISVLGTIGAGVWQGTPIAGAYGGTGVVNTGRTITLAGNLTIAMALAAPPDSPLTIDISGPTTVHLKQSGDYWPLPDQTGHSGDVLTTDGSQPMWGATPKTYVNVKDAPYFAKGDGVTDDSAAISQAIQDADGAAVYFPRGTYYVATDLAPTVVTTMVGDGSQISVIRGNPAATGPSVVSLISGSSLQDICVDGNLPNAVQPVPIRDCVRVFGYSRVTLQRTRIINASGNGVNIKNADFVMIADCDIDNCAGNGVRADTGSRARVSRTRITRTTQQGIYFLNSPYGFVDNNRVQSCGLLVAGIGLQDSDNTPVTGNIVQQCCIGIEVSTTQGRGLSSYGMLISSNDVIRNYMAGVRIKNSMGFQCSSNVLTDNGQGGNDNNTYTVEPGVAVDPANLGSAYQVGDVVSLVGGTGTAAKLLVAKIGGGGALTPDGLHPITTGVYTAFPPNTVSVSGGHGSGLKVILTGSIVSNGGSGYVSGEVLRGSNGAFTNPMRIVVRDVVAGAVKSYEVLDGGGYNGASLPGVIVFSGEGQSIGSGLSLIPSFGRRYSTTFNGVIPAGLIIYGPITGGIANSNVIDATKSGGVGILIQDDAAPNNGRAGFLNIVGNNLINNAYGIKGNTVSLSLDDDINFNSIIENNVIYP